MTDEEIVEVCPECDNFDIYPRTSHSLADSPARARYRCQACGAEFDEPHTRAARNNGAAKPSNGLAARLLDEYEPADVGGDSA